MAKAKAVKTPKAKNRVALGEDDLSRVSGGASSRPPTGGSHMRTTQAAHFTINLNGEIAYTK